MSCSIFTLLYLDINIHLSRDELQMPEMWVRMFLQDFLFFISYDWLKLRVPLFIRSCSLEDILFGLYVKDIRSRLKERATYELCQQCSFIVRHEWTYFISVVRVFEINKFEKNNSCLTWVYFNTSSIR